MQVDIDTNPIASQLVNKIIESIKRFRSDGFAVLSIPQSAGPPGGVQVVTSDGVDASRSQAGSDIRGILMPGQIRPKRQIDTPKTDAFSIAIEVPAG